MFVNLFIITLLMFSINAISDEFLSSDDLIKQYHGKKIMYEQIQHSSDPNTIPKIKKLVKEIEVLEATIKVNAIVTSYFLFNKTTSINIKNAYDNNMGYIVTADCAPLFFKSDNHFKDWAKEQKMTKINSLDYYISKNKIVQKCLSMSSAKERAVKSEHLVICRKKTDKAPEIYYGNKRNYKLENIDNKIAITQNILFTYKGKIENKSEVLDRLNKNKDCVQNFFSRHGLVFNVNYFFDSNELTKNKLDFISINLFDHISRSNALNIGLISTGGRSRNSSKVCATMIHELSHNLGLDDTYFDPNCPDRPKVKSNNHIMTDTFGNIENKMFDQDEVAMIISPLCPEINPKPINKIN